MVIEDEITKTVTERRIEIEQRITGEPVIIEKKSEPPVKKEQDTSTKTEELSAEPIEPTEVSFEHKRMSFERGVSIDQVLQEDIPVKEKPKSLEEKKMESIEEHGRDVDVDATSLTFHEKRLSFEQGIPVKEIIQKKTEETVSENVAECTNDPECLSETEKSLTKSETTSSVYENGKTYEIYCYLLVNALTYYRVLYNILFKYVVIVITLNSNIVFKVHNLTCM